MNKSHLRWIRDKVTSIDYIFELGKNRIGIIQTLLMFFTFVKVYKFTDEVTYMLVVALLVGVFLLGLFVDKIKIPQKMENQKEQRSPFMTRMTKTQEEILERVKAIEGKTLK